MRIRAVVYPKINKTAFFSFLLLCSFGGFKTLMGGREGQTEVGHSLLEKEFEDTATLEARFELPAKLKKRLASFCFFHWFSQLP